MRSTVNDNKYLKPWLDMHTAAEYLNISYRKIRAEHLAWEKYGVKTYRLGRKYQFKRAELDRFMEGTAL